MPTMQESLQAFSDRLLAVSASLEQQKSAIGRAENEVFEVLEQAATAFAPKVGENISAGETNALRETINRVFSDFTDGIRRWKQEMAERSEVRSKLEDMGTGLIVVVFGRTNAGKSTLGNFLRGRQLRVAAFDNAWKRGDFPLSPITVIERGKDAEATSDADWFAEGGVETTREAQMFRLPGLLWLDTPGFGSVNDGTLGALARKYVKRADLVVYLDDSDNPGLENITARLVEVLSEGRCTLVAINHSDRAKLVGEETGDFVFGDDGPLTILAPKSAEDRAAQEEYLTGLLRQRLPGQAVDAVSISMLLAKLAVENNDEEQYQASNVHALFSRILALIPDNEAVTRLKYRDAVRNCMTLVDMVRGREGAPEEGCTLAGLERQLAALEERICATDAAFDVENETHSIVAPILLQAREQLHALLRAAKDAPEFPGGEKERLAKMSAPGMFTGMAGAISAILNAVDEKKGEERRVDLAPLMEEVGRLALQGVEDKARRLLTDLWIQPAAEMRRKFPTVKAAVIKKKTEKHVYEVTETERCERDPSGIIEHFFSFFGKRYYSRRLVTREKEQIIDLGFNVEEVFAAQCRQLEEACTDFVRQEMELIREECLVRGLEIVRERRAVLSEARKRLEEQRRKLERELPPSGPAGEQAC